MQFGPVDDAQVAPRPGRGHRQPSAVGAALTGGEAPLGTAERRPDRPSATRRSELHAHLTSASPLWAGFLAAAGAALTTLGVADPERHAPALVALTDGLLFDRVAGAGVDPAARPDAYAMIDAFLRGLPRS